jgi:hypothetical protein
MLGLVVLSTTASLIAGVGVKLVLDRLPRASQITWVELAIGMAIIGIVVAPLASWIGWTTAVGNALSFREYWNGWELEAVEEIVPCEVNGPCRYEYACHCREVCSSAVRDDDCIAWKQECDDCPYFEFERNLYVRTTVGDRPIAWLAPEDYVARQITSTLPFGFGPRDYATPQFWLDCQTRVERGRPGPVTIRARYDNYILASGGTILRQHSSMVDQYRRAGLLPPIQHAIYDHYYADKVSFVGWEAEDEGAWQAALMHLNAVLGADLQGDLHLVIVQDPAAAINPDAYILALKAYWQDPDVWGDNCLSKNAIVVAIGTTDGETVAWARAQTGMPLGNEQMVVAIRSRLKGIALTPERVIGRVRGAFYVREEDGERVVRATGESGALRRVLWGFDDPATRFARVSMSGDDPEDLGGGFLYLDSEIQPKPGQKLAIVIVTFVLCSAVWLAFAVVGKKKTEKP